MKFCPYRIKKYMCPIFTFVVRAPQSMSANRQRKIHINIKVRHKKIRR